MFKKILIILLVVANTTVAQTWPNNSKQTSGISFTPSSWNYKGSTINNLTIQAQNPLLGIWFGLYTAYQLDSLFSKKTAVVPNTRQILNGYGLLGGTTLNVDITKSVDSTKLQTILNFYPKGDIRYGKLNGGNTWNGNQILNGNLTLTGSSNVLTIDQGGFRNTTVNGPEIYQASGQFSLITGNNTGTTITNTVGPLILSGTGTRVTTAPIGPTDVLRLGDTTITNANLFPYTGATKNALTNYKLTAKTSVNAGDSTNFANFVTVGTSLTLGIRSGTDVYTNALSWRMLTSTFFGLVNVNMGKEGRPIQQVALGDSSIYNIRDSIPPYTRAGSLISIEGIAIDARQDTTKYTVPVFTTQLTAIVNKLTSKGWPANRIILLIPSYFNNTDITHHGSIPYRRSIYTTAMQGVATSLGTRFLDLYPTMKAANDTLHTLILSDSLHMTAVGYAFAAGYIEAYISTFDTPIKLKPSVSNVYNSQYITGNANIYKDLYVQGLTNVDKIIANQTTSPIINTTYLTIPSGNISIGGVAAYNATSSLSLTKALAVTDGPAVNFTSSGGATSGNFNTVAITDNVTSSTGGSGTALIVTATKTGSGAGQTLTAGNFVTNIGTRATSATASIYYGVHSTTNGSTATTSTASNIKLYAVLGEVFNNLAAGETSINYGVAGKARTIAGKTGVGLYGNASGAGTNLAALIDTGVMRFNTLTAWGFMTLNATKDVTSNVITGLLKGNGTAAPTAAVAGVDYVLPATVSPTVIRSNATTLTLAYGKDYVFFGTATVWTLPALNGTNITRSDQITIKNAGTGNIVLNSNAGTTIYDSTVLVGTITISPGQAITLIVDGTQFNRE